MARVKRALKNIEEFASKNHVDLSYIPILDADPSLSARFLTKKDLEASYKLLAQCFEEIRSNEITHTILCYTITFNEYNFKWYVTLLKEIEDLLNVKPIKIPYSKCPSDVKDKLVEKNRKEKSLKVIPYVYQPFYSYLEARTGKFTPVYLEQNLEGRDEVTNYRLYYISEQYQAQEFQDETFPNWYLFKGITVYEKYNEKTNVRVRIDYIDNKLTYFIAGASDNWKKVETFEDLEHVIASLIFKKHIKIL